MLLENRATLTQYLIEYRRHKPHATGDFNELLLQLALATKAISRRVAHGALRGALGGEWVCTVAGTPGTWKQVRPAAVTTDPTSGTIPVGYWVWSTTTGHIKRHAGGYVWEVAGT